MVFRAQRTGAFGHSRTCHQQMLRTEAVVHKQLEMPKAIPNPMCIDRYGIEIPLG